jgi:DNA (cytosine-5)-methyltransferase 1
MPSGLIVPTHCNERKPIAVDLYAGAGGFSCGLQAAGFDVIAASEWSPTAAFTYLINLGRYPCQMVWVEGDKDREAWAKEVQQQWSLQRDQHKGQVVEPLCSGHNNLKRDTEGCRFFFLGDARKLTGRAMLSIMGLQQGDIDLVVGGPPCQGFSMGGKRDPEDLRNDHVLNFCRLVCELQPRSLCMENVPGLITMHTPWGEPYVDAITRVLCDGGFGRQDAIRKLLTAEPKRRLVNRGGSAADKGRERAKEKRKGSRTTPKPSQSVNLSAGLFDQLADEAPSILVEESEDVA